MQNGRGIAKLVLMGGLVAVMGLSACGGLSMADAEERCVDKAELADGVRGSIRGGFNQDGPVGGLNLTVSNAILNPQNPETVYDNCVFQLTGTGPSRPYQMAR